MKSFMAVLQWIETKPSLADAPTCELHHIGGGHVLLSDSMGAQPSHQATDKPSNLKSNFV